MVFITESPYLMSKFQSAILTLSAFCLLVGFPQIGNTRLLEKVVSCPCPGHKNTESNTECLKHEKILKPFDFHLNIGDASFKEGVLMVHLKQAPVVVSDRPGVHERLECALCVKTNIKKLGDEEVVYVLWQPQTKKTVVFKGKIRDAHPLNLSIEPAKGSDVKAIEGILAYHKAHEASDLEVAILSYAVMTKETEKATSEKTQLHDRVNYFMMSEGPVKVEKNQKKEAHYPYDISFRGVKDIVEIDVTGKREDLTPDQFIDTWTLGPNSFALNPPDGNFTIRLKDGEQVFNAMKFNGPPRHAEESDTLTLEGTYLEGSNNKPHIPEMIKKDGSMESAPDHNVGVFLDQRGNPKI